jgi:hypothetical protein
MLQLADEDPHPGFAVFQRICGAPPFADVDEGHDDAVDLVFDGAVGPQPRQIPSAIVAMDFALD